MPSIRCTCGHQIGIGSFPNPNVWHAISEQDYDHVGTIESGEQLDRLFWDSATVYLCRKCGDLIVRWKDSGEYQFFKPN
jgi:hypothetical protein